MDLLCELKEILRYLLICSNTKSSHRRCSVKNVEISQNSQEKTCARVSLLIKLQAWGSGTGTGISCKFCEISSSTSLTEHLQVTASEKR